MKRVANKDLNSDNWDEEDVPEERGKFSEANADIVSKRKIITVRRRPAVSQSSVFKSFAGVGNIVSSTVNVVEDDNREKHLNNLKQLNKIFLENIQKFINENDCCILSPLFEDYHRHLATIKAKYPLSTLESNESKSLPITGFGNNMSTEKSTTSLLFNKDPEVASIFNKAPEVSSFFNKAPEVSSIFNKAPEASSIFNKAPEVATSSPFNKVPEMPTMPFSFLPSSNTTSPFPLFGANKAAESSTTAAPTSSDLTTNEDGEEYIPPTAESRDIKETDSVFDIRCKLFYQSDSNWKEKGVGNIFIKPLSGPNKFQLVMRADNTLGTILLNVLVTKSMPLSVTKNNVSLVAMTDFTTTDLKPTPLLIRVKSAENAEKLLAAMKTQLD